MVSLTSKYDRNEQPKEQKDDIENVDLRDCNGWIITPIWITSFLTKTGKTAHKILFKTGVDTETFAAYVNDKKFCAAIDGLLAECANGAERYTIPPEDRETFKVAVRTADDQKFVYLNPYKVVQTAIV